MNGEEALRLLNELLSVEDNETENSNNSDNDIESVTPTLDIETVIKSATECFHQQKCLADDEHEESDNESPDDAIDDLENDPDYIPSADTSFAQSSFLMAANVQVTAIIDSTSSSQNDTQTSTSAPSRQEETLQAQPSTSAPRRQEETLQIQTKFKKRQRNPDQWKRNIKKRKVNRGEEYTTKGGNIKSARKTGPDCRCRMKCFDRVNETQRGIILKAFNDLENAQLQDAYLGACINSIPPKRSRPRNEAKRTGKGSRKWTYEYCVKPETIKVKVCFKAFMSMHGIGLTRAKRVRTPGIALPIPDQRGRHGNHICISNKILDKIMVHINSFPKRESHYSRQNNLNRRYLDERLNVKRMWLLYLQENEPAQRILYHTDKKSMKPIVKYKYYLHIFNNCFNLTFGQPKSDTCPLCDKYDILLKAEDDIDKKKSIQKQRDLHQMRADSGYKTLNKYAQKSKTDDTMEVYTFDFQQNLPAPTLTAGDMFYSRMLWTYNFGLHDAKTEDGIMHMWSEAEAGRGSSEVCSCLRETLLKRHETHRADHLILFSDGCAGQNKNKAVMNFLFELAKHGVYKSIQHFFLFRGHTYLPNDRDFSHIEKRKKVEKVKRPTDWEDIVKDSRLSQPFEVLFLDHKKFFNYKALADAKLKITFKCSDGESLMFKDVMWFSYGKSQQMSELMDTEIWTPHVEEVWCRYTHSRMEPWKKINPIKRLKTNQCTTKLVQKYAKPIGIKAAKKKDLLSLAAKGLVDEETKAFYESLPVRQDKQTAGSDEDEDDYLN